jgi:hypothetical protein
MTFFFDYRRDSLWQGAPRKQIRDKIYGTLLNLDLTTWADRTYYFLGRWYDLEMQLLLRSVVSNGETVIDVGANRGEFALVASHTVGKDGKVVCFEPNQCPGAWAVS